MSFLSGIMKSIINPATLMQLAMGPAGWASLATKMIVSAVAQQVIQQLGQKLGLPQSVISMAQSAFAAASGTEGGPMNFKDAVAQVAAESGMSAFQQGQLQRATEKTYDNMSKIVENMMRKVGQGSDEDEAASVGSGSGSVLMRIARAMGKLMDEKMNAMAAKGDQLGKLGNDGALTKDGSFNAKGQSQYGKLTSEMQALGQELSMISQAVSNSLKSIGEASTTMARKG